MTAARRKANAEAQLTLPKWEFARGDAERGTVKAVRVAATLKSHHLNSLTLSDSTLRAGTMQHRELPPPHYLVRMRSIMPPCVSTMHCEPPPSPAHRAAMATLHGALLWKANN